MQDTYVSLNPQNSSREEKAIRNKIHLNPILNSFQHTFHKYKIDKDLVDAFMKSMRMDLTKKKYNTLEEYKEYIYGSADVVGLMCLRFLFKGMISSTQNSRKMQ